MRLKHGLIAGISPPEFDNLTLAVIRGRLVRYLMRSKEVLFVVYFTSCFTTFRHVDRYVGLKVFMRHKLRVFGHFSIIGLKNVV